MKRYVSSWYTGDPDPTGELEGRARFLMQIKSWKDAYGKFIEISEKYYPNQNKINTEIEKLYNRYKGNPHFDEAWKRWIEN